MTAEKTDPYENTVQHLYEELDYLDLLIGRELSRYRRFMSEDRRELFKGLFISDEEIDSALGDKQRRRPGHTDYGPVEDGLKEMRRRIDERKKASLTKGIYLALPVLSRIFGLEPTEELIILICLAPEIDIKYERIYAYLQDDISRKYPCVDLLIRLLSSDPAEKVRFRQYFSPVSPLLHFRLLRLSDSESPLARPVRLDEAISGFLLGYDGRDGELAACMRMVRPGTGLSGLRWPEDMRTKLLDITAEYLRSGVRTRKLIYHFYGPPGTGKKSLAAALCYETGISLMAVDMGEMLQRAQVFEETLIKIFREAVLRSAAVFLENFDAIADDEEKSALYRRTVAHCIDDFSWVTFISTERDWKPADLFGGNMYMGIELPAPDIDTRAKLWADLLAGLSTEFKGTDCSELAAKFRFTPGRVQGALEAAHDYARMRGGERGHLTREDLYRACRSQSTHKLGALARRLKTVYVWDDLILPKTVANHLREICAHVKHRRKVYGEWGFERRLAYGKGLSVLLHGQSGTGKTMAVQIMAKELGLDVFKIDLSTVVNKYIGETEKNLGKIFNEAETSNAILFFDEADALFGKRSEVKDAHDRYANIEINYLLQRIEEYEGLVILATNLRKNIDEAFFRRMNFAVELPFPEEADRYRIWRRHFPGAAPVSADIDFNFLASRFTIAGGNIKNIVLNAAFMAADNSGTIHMEHLVRATIREYEKMGRVCTGADIAPYHSLFDESGEGEAA